jgi:hypothetical protein
MEILFVFCLFMAYGLGAWTGFDCAREGVEKLIDESWRRRAEYGLLRAKNKIEEIEDTFHD